VALVATCFTVGATTVLFLLVSVHRVGIGAHGYGYLLAAAGVGGLVASALTDRFTSARHMAAVTAATLGVIAVSIGVLAAVTDPAEAYVAAAVWGGAYFLLELLVVTLMQRCVAAELLGQATAAVDVLAYAAVLLGAVTGPVSQHFGLTTAILVVAVPALLAGLIIAARSKELDVRAVAAADALKPRLTVLGRVGVLVGSDHPTLEALASRLTEEHVDAGTVVVRQGAAPDDFFVVVEGTLDVASSGGKAQRPTKIRSLAPGDVFGEIGLVEQRPRTATVTATSAATLYRIPGEDFLTLVAGTTPVAGALRDLAAGRLQRTHRETALG
jgi:CRP-like cAMP-binding protein